MAANDLRDRLRQWLASGAARLVPPTFPQREIWENSPVPPGDWGNHICGVIEIRGALTPGESEAALQRVVDRQEALRTSFLPGKDGPVQLVRTAAAPLQSFRELTAAEAKPEALEEILRAVYAKPFDLVQGPLHRVEMLRRSANDHVLAFSIHHGIADGWSLGVFVQDLCTAYVMGLDGLRKGVATAVLGLSGKLEPVPQSYSAWAAAERAFWTPAELARRAPFWQDHLRGARLVWGRPADPKRPSGPLHRHRLTLPGSASKAVKALATRSGATLFSTLLAAFQVALARWSGVSDITVGTPVANRHKTATHQTMGYFAGVVPLRAQVDPQRTFADHLSAVQATALDGFAHAMPFAELVRAVNPAPALHPVFDVRFALQNHPIPDVNLPRIKTRLRMRSTGTTRFDLGCEVTELGSELEIVWLFRDELTDLMSIESLHTLYRDVLAAAAADPSRRLAQLVP